MRVGESSLAEEDGVYDVVVVGDIVEEVTSVPIGAGR